MQGVHLRKYGVETKIPFELYEVDGVDLRTDAVDAGSDCSIMKDEGAEATCINDFVDEGKGYSITLTATEMQAARIVVYIVDSATKVWLDKVIVIETYGHASAQHAMDLDDAVRGGMTALPNAAADAAGGLPISDAGGLDLDTKLANTNEVTAARMGALTDWIDAGRLDALLDAIKAKTDNLPIDPADDSDIDAQLAIIAGYIDTEITAIKNAIENGTYGLSAIRTRGDAAWITATGFSTHNAAAVKTAIEAAGSHLTLIKVVTNLINGLLEDSDGYRYTAKALEEAPSGAGLTGTQNTALILIRDIMEGDAVIDITTTPWQLVIKKKGTETEVVKKDLKNISGVNLTAITTVIGQQLEPS